MKNLNDENTDQLLQIIQKKPAQRIVHFSDGSHFLSKKLAALCKDYESDYYLNCCKDACYDKAVTKYAEQPHVHVMKFNLLRPRYKIQGIEYDYLFATLDWEENDKEAFLQKCYPIIRTGGNMILIIPNSSYAQRDEWSALLEEMYYVSSSFMDDMFEDYDVIVTKRMHGWGKE